MLGHAQARQLGVSVLVSLGSRADVSGNDLLEWCEADDRTAVVMLYLETFGSPAISAHPASSSIATAVGGCRALPPPVNDSSE